MFLTHCVVLVWIISDCYLWTETSVGSSSLTNCGFWCFFLDHAKNDSETFPFSYTFYPESLALRQRGWNTKLTLTIACMFCTLHKEALLLIVPVCNAWTAVCWLC